MAGTGVSKLWDYVAKTRPVKSVMSWINDRDLNDDNANFLGNQYAENASLGRTIQWHEVNDAYRDNSQAYDGVSI
jgi:hypothetical protein